jgi:signal peptidase I
MESLLLVTASAVLALLLGRAIHHRLAFVTEVVSLSMAPALTPGRRLLTRRQSAAARPLRRGDVVVVESAELRRPVIKRVVGLPGEHIDVGKDGRVQVAGHDLPEPYVVHRGGRPSAFDVPTGHLLLLGDNRARSSDARMWRQPYVPVSAVLGRVLRHGWSSAADETDPRPPRCAAGPIG